MFLSARTAGGLWLRLIHHLYHRGTRVVPRGQECYETTNMHLFIEDAQNNIFVNEERRLNYRFMVAEWLWIWFGHDDVATITRYNKVIGNFSDNGVNFNGSYGVPVKAQWPRIIDTLTHDPFSRQAVLQIYRPPTGPTKDVPCTLTVQFLIRNMHLETIVNMRSSDVWLGIPYDVFNFSMLANILAGQLGVINSSLSLNLGSSHLYATNREAVGRILERPETADLRSPRLPGSPPLIVDDVLTLGDGVGLGEAFAPWCYYADALTAKTSVLALNALRAASQWRVTDATAV